MIELKDLNFKYSNGHLVFSKVNIALRRGEMLALIGPSGHGKSTLLKIISGLIPPTNGQVFINGQDLYPGSFTGSGSLMDKMGMLFQKNALFDSLTVEENLSFPLSEKTKFSKSEINYQVKKMLKEVELPGTEKLFPSELSGGMQKRLGIARALILSPEIMLYDDPTAGLDPITSRNIINLICRFQKQSGATVIVITNEMKRAYQVADKIAFLAHGELILTGSHEETRSHPNPKVQNFIQGKADF